MNDDRIEVVACPQLFDELSQVLRRPKFENYIGDVAATEFIARLRRHARVVADAPPRRCARSWPAPCSGRSWTPAETRALLAVAMNLTDERIDIDDQALRARPGARSRGPGGAVGEHSVQVADVPERERAEERAERRRGRNMMP